MNEDPLDLQRQLDALQSVQLLVTLDLFEALLSVDPAAAHRALGRLALRAVEQDPAPEAGMELSAETCQLLAEHVRLISNVFAQREAVQATQELVKRASDTDLRHP